MNDWEMQPRIKPKPGAQGTLFHGGTSQLNPVRRWPRGYTPERQAEVRKALGDVSVTANKPAKAEAEVVDTIARSTMPVKHLQGLTEINDVPRATDAGDYWHDDAKIAVAGLGHPDHPDHAEAPKTLIHELGHHADHVHTKKSRADVASMEPLSSPQMIGVGRFAQSRNPPTSSIEAQQRIMPGVREANADNYYKEHYRTRGRVGNNKAPSEGLYESSMTPDQLDKKQIGYREVSTTDPRPNLNQQQFEGLF